MPPQNKDLSSQIHHQEHHHYGPGGFALFLSTVIICVTVLAISWLGFGVYRDTRMQNTVTVKGSAKQEGIKSDRIVWTTNVSVRDVTLTAASSKLEKDVKAARDYLKAKGIAESEIFTESVNTMKEYTRDMNGNMTNEISGYMLDQSIRVESGEVDKVESVSRDVTTLINQGIEITSNTPQYLYTKAASLRKELLSQAADDGLARAKILADRAGGDLGMLTDARMGVFQILPKYSIEVSDYGENDTFSKEKDAMAVVTLTYQLK